MSLFSLGSYYYHHYKAHKNPEWARRNLPWHYDHHMAKNQNLNFGVRSDAFDRLLGTREDFASDKKARHEKLLKLHKKYKKRQKK